MQASVVPVREDLGARDRLTCIQRTPAALRIVPAFREDRQPSGLVETAEPDPGMWPGFMVDGVKVGQDVDGQDRHSAVSPIS